MVTMGRVAVLAVALVVALSGCAPGAERDQLASVVAVSISQFDAAGGSETTFAGDSQHALIYDPTSPPGEQVVTADLTDAASPAFADPSAITIHSIETLIDSPEFEAAVITRTRSTFTASSDAFGVTIDTRDGVITQVEFSGGGETTPSQVVVVTYGITPEARKIFESVGR